MTPKRVILVGAYPPPYGGISVHIQRLAASIKHAFGVKVIDLHNTAGSTQEYVVRPRRNPLRLIQIAFEGGPTVVHLHVSAITSRLHTFCALLKGLSYFKPTIVTIHSGSFNEGFRQLQPRLRGRLIAALQRCVDVVVVNEVQKFGLVKEGIAQERIHVVPAFLPPVHETYSLPDYMASQLQGRELIVTSGYGMHYYRFHTLLDALAQLSPEIAERVALVVCLYNQYDAGYVGELERRAFRSAVPCIITRDLRPEHFADILRRGRIYVRATDRDGDAVALREAAYFGLQVIASDCVLRPAGSVLFSTNESSILADKVEAVWHDKGLGLVQFDPTVGLRNLMSIYQTLLGT